MSRHLSLCFAATLAIGWHVEAIAGGCCPVAYVDCGCGAGETYVVNQGPLFSGPGHELERRVPDLMPSGYPYGGHVYSGYPYGMQISGRYPRGHFSPFAGYPHAEPYRLYYRS